MSSVGAQTAPLHATGSGRSLHFGKCACKRRLVPSRTSAGVGEQKANQAVRSPLGSLVISSRHCQTDHRQKAGARHRPCQIRFTAAG